MITRTVLCFENGVATMPELKKEVWGIGDIRYNEHIL